MQLHNRAGGWTVILAYDGVEDIGDGAAGSKSLSDPDSYLLFRAERGFHAA